MLYRIQSTALGQSGNTLQILPGASVTVLDKNGALARIYADAGEVTELPNPTTADSAGGYDFYLAYDDYYDLSITLNGQAVDDRIYPIEIGLGARVAADAGTATTQAGVATTQAGISTAQAGISTAQAVIATTKAGEAAGSAAGAATSEANAALFDGPRFDAVAAAAAYAGYTDGGFSIVNPTGETFQYDAASTATADGALIVTATGMGVGRLISTRAEYKSFVELFQDNRLLAVGTILRTLSDQEVYKVVSSGGLDWQGNGTSTAGGMRVDRITKIFYVDSVSGSDLDSGLTSALAFATLGAVPLSDGVHIRLMAGSEWREELDLGEYVGVTIEGWGDFVANGIPKVNGTEIVVQAWDDSTARADANANVYSVLWSHSIIGGARNIPPALFEDGAMLQFATSLANCQATPGTFWHEKLIGTGTPITVYVHPTGSTNPNVDGRVYEITSREYVVNVGDNSTIRWLHCHAAGNTLGSVVHGHDCTIENVLATGNPLHSVNGGSGLRRRVVGYQPIVFPNEGGLIIEHFIEDSKRKTIRNEQCIAIGPAAVGALDIGGFGGHDSDGQGMDRIEYIDCSCRNATMDTEAQFVRIERANMKNGSMLFATRNDGELPEVEVIDPRMIVTDLATGGAARKFLMAHGGFTEGKNPQIYVDGLRLYADVAWLAAFNNPANLHLTGSVLAFGAASSNALLMNMQSVSQEQNAVINYNIIDGPAGEKLWDVRAYESNGGSLDSDFNVIWPLITNGSDSLLYRGPDGLGGQISLYTLPDIQATFGLELNSVATDPNILDAANGDFRYTSNGGIPGCGLARPNVKYTPILNDEAEALEWLIYGEVK